MDKSFKRFLVLAMVVFLGLNIYFGTAILSSIRGIHIPGPAHVEHMDEHSLAQHIAQAIAQQQNRLFHNANALPESFDDESLEVTLLVTAMPIEFGADSSAVLYAQDRSADMQMVDGVLEGRISLALNIPLEGYRIALTTADVTRSESFDTWGGMLFSVDGEISWFRSGELGVVLHPAWQPSDFRLPFNDNVKSVRVFAQEDGEEVFGTYIENNIFDQTIELDLPEDALLVFYADVLGESGLTYRHLLQAMMRSSDDWPEWPPFVHGGGFGVGDGDLHSFVPDLSLMQLITADGRTVDITRGW